MATVLSIPTYDESGQAVHPDVVRVGDVYWMGCTPYPYDEDDYENPSIFSSPDGLDWSVPDGVTNPLVAQPAGGTNSDSDLVYADGVFHYFYREVIYASHRERIYLITSTDGVTWSGPTLVWGGTAEFEFLSPAVVHGGWRMWSVNKVPAPNTLELRTADAPEGPWSEPITCDVVTPPGRDLWHVDVTRFGRCYVAALVFCDSGTSGTAASLTFGSSRDGAAWEVGATVIAPAGSVERVYRGSLMRDGDVWRLWYSDRSSAGVWRILHENLPDAAFPDLWTPSALAGAQSAWPSMRP